jgi:hypothetical protein
MKETKLWSTALLPAIIILWFMFGTMPFLFPNMSDSATRILGVSFTAATALFTGIAFVVSFYSLSKQQENIKKQQDSLSKQIELSILSVFMDTLKIITSSQSFKQCQNYIFSENFFQDRETIRVYLKKSMGEDITLNDYSIVLDKNEGLVSIGTGDLSQLRQNRDKIKNFCMRMEYIGAVVLALQDKAAEKMLLDLYGHTIIKTYKRLGPLIDDNKQSDGAYKHYALLYKLANERGL